MYGKVFNPPHPMSTWMTMFPFIQKPLKASCYSHSVVRNREKKSSCVYIPLVSLMIRGRTCYSVYDKMRDDVFYFFLENVNTVLGICVVDTIC